MGNLCHLAHKGGIRAQHRLSIEQIFWRKGSRQSKETRTLQVGADSAQGAPKKLAHRRGEQGTGRSVKMNQGDYGARGYGNDVVVHQARNER